MQISDKLGWEQRASAAVSGRFRGGTWRCVAGVGLRICLSIFSAMFRYVMVKMAVKLALNHYFRTSVRLNC